MYSSMNGALEDAWEKMGDEFDPEDTTVKETDVVVEPNGNIRPPIAEASGSLPLILLAGAAILLIGLTKK